MNKKRIVIVIFFFIYLSISITSIHLLTDGIVGMRHDWVSPAYPEQIEDHIGKEFNTWSDQNSFSYIRRNLMYFKVYQGMIAFATGFDATLFSITTIFSLLTLSGFSMFFLSKTLSSSLKCGFIAGLFYMLNPVVFNKIVAGHTGFMFSYALAPLIILFFLLATDKNRTNWSFIVLSGLFFGLAFAQHHFIILIPSIILLIIVIRWISKFKINIKELLHLVVLSLIGFGMHLFWIIPYISYSGLEFSRLGPITYHALKNAPSIWQAILMSGWSQPYDYTQLVSEGVINPLLYLTLFIIVILSLISFLFKKDVKDKVIYLALFLIGIFLTTGINNPGGEIFRYAYTDIQILRIFRDPYTFTFYIAFSLSVLLSFVSKDLFHIIQKKIKRRKKLVSHSFLILLTIFILFSSFPLLNGNYSNQLQTFSFPQNYKEEYKKIANEETISRVFFFPSLQPMKIEGNEYAGRDNMIMYPPKPSFPQNVDRLDRFNRLHMYTILNLRRGIDISNVFKITSTEYIVNRESYESWYYKYVPGSEDVWGGNTFNEVLNQYELDHSSPSFTTYKFNYSPFIKITTPYFCSANLDIISSIPTSVLNYSSIIFSGDITKELMNSLNMAILTNEGNYNKEYELSVLNSTDLIRLKTEETNANKGWSYDDTIWRLYPNIASDTFFNGFQTVLTSSMNARLNNSFNIQESGNYKVFARIFQNENGGNIKVSIDDNMYNVDTKNKINSFIFKDLGVIQLDEGPHSLTLENIKGLNAVSYLTFTPINRYNKFLQHYKQRLSKIDTFIYVFEAENDFFIKNTDGAFLLNINKHRTIDLESVRNAWKEILIEKSGLYTIAIRGSGEFDFSMGNNNFEFNNENFSYEYYGPFDLEEKQYNLSFSSVEKSTLTSLTFEHEEEYWGKQTNNFKREFDSDSYEGDFSLRLSTKSEDSRSWSWIRGESINVTPGNKYRIITHMKYSNVKQAHIPIEGFNTSSESWQQLDQVPSGKDGTTFGWNEYDLILEIPVNITKIRIVLNAGWVLDNTTDEAITWFDDFRIYPVQKGVLDNVWIYSSDTEENILDLFSKHKSAQVQSFEKISQTKYHVDINASKPFLLSFAEAYDAGWIAEIQANQKTMQYNSIPIYNAINGFWIDETGEIDVIIRYEPQETFDNGLFISMSIIIGCFGFIIFSYAKRYKYSEIGKCLLEKLKKH